ncbi:MAG: hypothetical protein H7338_24750 [Candidatus Sericytochromatia bacterium]|nr:hypothetical protein [Candidatus Sericytochromatia bacterium]
MISGPHPLGQPATITRPTGPFPLPAAVTVSQTMKQFTAALAPLSPPAPVHGSLMQDPVAFAAHADAIHQSLIIRFGTDPHGVLAEFDAVRNAIHQASGSGDSALLRQLQQNLTAIDVVNDASPPDLQLAIGACLYAADQAVRGIPLAEPVQSPHAESLPAPAAPNVGARPTAQGRTVRLASVYELLVLPATVFAMGAAELSLAIIDRYRSNPKAVAGEFWYIESEIAIQGQFGGDRVYLDKLIANLSAITSRACDGANIVPELHQMIAQCIYAGKRALGTDH